MEERTHQREFRALCREFANGSDGLQEILAEVVPGGGKSAYVTIAINELVESGYSSGVYHIAPRVNLCNQIEEQAAEMRDLIGHQGEVRWTKANELNPRRGHPAMSTTCQAVLANPTWLEHELERQRRPVLILDEGQHYPLLEDCRADTPDGSYTRSMAGAVAAARSRSGLVVRMGGMFRRNRNRERIDGLSYLRAGDHWELDYTVGNWIRYTRAQALAERAIVPAYFSHTDGKAQWEVQDLLTGQITSREIESLQHLRPDQSAALDIVLETDFAEHLLDVQVNEWRLDQRERNPYAKLLVAAPNQKIASAYLKVLRRLNVQRVGLAVSDEPNALKVIQQARRANNDGGLQCLVTVAMAYEGLDIPAICHIACLTRYRSVPWIYQLLARGWRYNRNCGLPWEEQWLSVRAPDDSQLNAVFNDLKREQEPYVMVPDEDETHVGPGGGGGGFSDSIVIASASQPTGATRASDLDGHEVAPDEVARIEQAKHQSGISAPTVRLQDFLRYWGVAVPGVSAQSPAAEPGTAKIHAGPRQREDRLRSEIRSLGNRRDKRLGLPEGTTNADILRQFKKPRDQQTEEDLRAVVAWLKERERIERQPSVRNVR